MGKTAIFLYFRSVRACVCVCVRALREINFHYKIREKNVVRKTGILEINRKDDTSDYILNCRYILKKF